MRFYTVLSSRPEYYDRSPLDGLEATSLQDSPPISSVTEWTYTVPAARKAFCEAGQLSVLRTSAAGSAALVFSLFQITPSGLGASSPFVAYIQSNTVNDRNDIIVTSLGLLQAGDSIKNIINDSSTGGTCTYRGNLKFTEFTA